MSDTAAPPLPRVGTVSVGGPVDRTRLTLGIHGDELDPQEISALLNCTPTHCHRQGDTRKGTLPPWKRGAWLLSVENEAPASPTALLESLLSQVPQDPAFWGHLRQRFDVQLGFGLFLDGDNRGFELPHATLARIVELGFTIDFDIYG